MGSEPQVGNHRTILIVDDEPAMLRVLRLKFQNAGFEVVTAVNGKDGLTKLKSVRPQVVITDQNMPQMTGIELMEASRELFKEKPFLLIFLTSTTDREDLDRIQVNSHILFMSKPFSPRQILKKVVDYLDSNALEEEG